VVVNGEGIREECEGKPVMKSQNPLREETFLFRTWVLLGIGVWLGLIEYLILRLVR
jgi:hypothetical protein